MALQYLHVALLLIVPFVSGLVMPMTKPNGDPDIVSIMNHVTQMEQTMASLQDQVLTSTVKLATVKDKLQIAMKELNSSKVEITAVKAQLRVAENDISLLKHDLQKRPDLVELANLKTAFESLKVSHNSLVKQNNYTVTGSVSADVKSNMRDIQSLISELLTTKSDVNQTIQDLQSNKADLDGLRRDVLALKSKSEADIISIQSKQNATEQELTSTKAVVQSTSADVKAVKSQVSAISGDVSGIHQKLSMVERKTKADIISIQSKQNATEQELTSTEAVVQSTSADVKAVKSQVSPISAAVNYIRQNLSMVERKTNKDVAFQASQRGGTSSGWSTLKFDTVDYNTGSGYNKTLGIFTAPVDGTYIFWANVMYYNPVKVFHIHIYKGQQILTKGFYQMGDGNDQGVASTMTVTHLDKGDQVHFTTDSTTDYIMGYDYSSYGGALLHAI